MWDSTSSVSAIAAIRATAPPPINNFLLDLGVEDDGPIGRLWSIDDYHTMLDPWLVRSSVWCWLATSSGFLADA